MWAERLDEVADAGALQRGRKYAREGRVIDLAANDDSISARVEGTSLYSVELTSDAWFCDCPVGQDGLFCKHCVAVVLVAEGAVEIESLGDQEDEDSADAWLESLAANELRTLLTKATVDVDGMASFVGRAYAAASNDLDHLMAEVKGAFTPHRRFYEYGAANDYAYGVEPTVALLEEQARAAPSADLLEIVEKAIELVVRTIMRSDDSSGLQGAVAGRLLDVHQRIALTAELDARRQRKLVKWLHTFMVSKQDFIMLNIDEYAPALRKSDIDTYRRLVADLGPANFAADHARGRLAILDRDHDAIIRIFGRGFPNVYGYVQVVQALDEAGLHDRAIDFARRGLAAHAHDWRSRDLVERLVAEATQRGDVAEIARIRAGDFAVRPSSSTYIIYRKAALAAHCWANEEPMASELLANHSTRDWIVVLRTLGRHDEAWIAAEAEPDAVGAEMWSDLCGQRQSTHPDQTLPHYRRLVDDVLVTADRQNYRSAVQLLRKMRDAAEASGGRQEYVSFVADVMERNRRRPTFVREAKRAGLIRG